MSLWDHQLRAAVRKDPSGACLLGSGWCFLNIRYLNTWKMAPPPSYHPLLVLTSLQMAFPMLGSRTANLLPLGHLIFENRACHIHLCFGTGSVLKASLNYTSQSPEEGSEVTAQEVYLPLQVSWGSFWKSTDKVWTASELDPIRIISSGAEGTPFIACSLTCSLLAHTTFLLICGLWGNCFYLHLIGLWSDLTGQLMRFPTRTFSGPEGCFCS